jgi:hypothetical protein
MRRTPRGAIVARFGAPAASCLCAVALLVLAGCGSVEGRSRGSSQRERRAAIEDYLGEVEPIRLAVNSLLKGADPILGAFHERRIRPGAAAARMDRLERRFASYALDVAALTPSTAALRRLNSGYAATYVLEDSYLSALVAGLTDGALGDLPDTQAEQRAAIIRWRIGLSVLARAAGASLPPDLQQAGRGEIAPSLDGS